MTTLREAAQQALEALEKYRKMMFVEAGCRFGEGDAAITALRAALAEPVQEAGCHVFNVTVTGKLHEWEPTTFAFALRDGKHALYTAPPQRKPLTDEEMQTIYREFMLYQDGLTPSGLQRVTRAIERAHGIGGSNG